MMKQLRRIGLPYLLSVIAITSVSPSLADDESGENVTVDFVRDLALLNYRANYAALGGVRCKMASTITSDLGLLSRQSAGSEVIADDRVVHSSAVNELQSRRAGDGVLADPDSQRDGDEEDDEHDSPDRIVRVRAIGSRKKVIDPATGTSSTISEHRVFFLGPSVRNERYNGDAIEGIHIRSGVECSYESTQVCSAFGAPLVFRGRIDDPQIRSGPIIDPRDFGASSGIGRLEEMLAKWDVVSATSCVVKCARSGLIAIKLQEPLAARAYQDLVNECVLYLDPRTKLLPVIVEHFQQHQLSQVIEITYAKCDWLPDACYLASEAVYAMPADPEMINCESVAEITAHSRQRFIVTEAAPFEPTDSDRTFRLRATNSVWLHELDATGIAAPSEPAPDVMRTGATSDGQQQFLAALLVIAISSIGIVLRQQLSTQ